MKRRLDMNKIAAGLRAERRGKVRATGGFFGAMQLLADVEARFRVPAGGGRPTFAKTMKRRDWPVVLLVWVLFSSACGAARAPANLSPQATTAWYATRVIRGLDLLRDTAIDAAAQRPPILTDATARNIVRMHEAAIKTVHEAPTGWAPTVTTALSELERSLTVHDRAVVHPYIEMTRALLKSVQP